MPIVFNSSYTVQMSKVSSDIQDNFLTVTFCEIRKTSYIFPTHTGTEYPFPFQKRNGDIVRKIGLWQDWNPAEQTPNLAALSQIHGASVSKAFDVTFSLQLFIHLSLWLLPLPMCCSAWQMSHYLAVSTSCHLKGQPRRHPHSSMQWTVVVSALGLRLCGT